MRSHVHSAVEPERVSVQATALTPGGAAQGEEAFPQLRRNAEDLQETLRTHDAVYQQLYAYVQDLQRVMRERDRALAEAKAAAAAKGVLLANMSHEFRTPLTSVLGFAELLARRARTAADRDLLSRIYRAGQRIEGLVENLLTMTRLDAGTLAVEFAYCDIVAVLGEECAKVERRARAKGLDWQTAFPARDVRVWLDESCMRQALAALLDNAVKFTPAGGVTITLEADASSGMRIDIADTGIGIRPDDRNRILAPFEQADGSSTRAIEGAGLGLPVAEALLGTTGCSLRFTSTPGQGSVFSIELPGAGPNAP